MSKVDSGLRAKRANILKVFRDFFIENLNRKNIFSYENIRLQIRPERFPDGRLTLALCEIQFCGRVRLAREGQIRHGRNSDPA